MNNLRPVTLDAPSPTDKEEYDTLRRECLRCDRCALREGRTQVVFGTGDPRSEVLFVGEGPGAEEDRLGEPFVGRAGQLLDVMLASVGLRRQIIYIANIVKCRPPGNRDPLNLEQDACEYWLKAQIKCIRPKILVCLGRIAATRVIRHDFKITAEHGQWTYRDGLWITALYHPAFLLRDPRHKPETFADMQAVEAKMREVCEHTIPD